MFAVIFSVSVVSSCYLFTQQAFLPSTVVGVSGYQWVHVSVGKTHLHHHLADHNLEGNTDVHTVKYFIICYDLERVMSNHHLENRQGNQQKLHRGGDIWIRPWRLKCKFLGRDIG